MRKAATIRDVAKEAGVSIAVVSRVINDGTGPVAPQTRERVVEAIEPAQLPAACSRPRVATTVLDHDRPGAR